MRRVEGEIVIDQRWRNCSTSLPMSETSRAAARALIFSSHQSTWRPGADVVAAHALSTPVFADGFVFATGTGYEEWLRAWKELRSYTQRAMEQDWCQPLAEAGIAFRAVIVDGGPEALIALAVSVEADILVVGRRGRGGFAELVLGSFSHHLVHHCTHPVVVVPPLKV
jgi:nucleotide-binding universal stress UspA family protein